MGIWNIQKSSGGHLIAASNAGWSVADRITSTSLHVQSTALEEDFTDQPLKTAELGSDVPIYERRYIPVRKMLLKIDHRNIGRWAR
jgi:hypothetical protein